MYDQMTSNSRIDDVVHILSDPIEYVSGVLGNFVSCRYDPETSKVRIGVTGKGDAPNYKIEEPNVTVTLAVHPLSLAGHSLSFDMTKTPARTFNGRNHREMTELDDHERHGENWSTKTMSNAELKALLSSLSQSESQH